MKLLISLLLLSPFFASGQFKLTRPYANHYGEAPLIIYSEPGCINNIDEIPAGSAIIFIVGPGDQNSYLVYRKGITGYASKSHLFFDGKPPVFTEDHRRQPMIEAAKKEEVEYERYINAKQEKERIENAIKNKTLINAGLSVTYPEYLDGEFYCGYEISFTNYSSNKIIKYIYLTLSAYNTVDDLVVSKKFTLVGPIQFMGEANYKDKFAFDGKRAISYYKIKKIEVLYTNGSRKEYSGSLLKSITN